MRYLFAYLGAGVVFAIIDAVWLTFMGPKIYKPIIGSLLAEKVSLAPAAVFYLMYIAGIVVIAVMPQLRDGTWKGAAFTGAALGLIAYGTYDLTNQATMKVWATKITVLDMGYGMVATGLAATVAFFAAKWAMKTFG